MSEAEVRDEYPRLRDIDLFGRRQIFVPYDDLDDSNVIQRVNMALAYHGRNLIEEEYLYWYRRGVQPILARKKEIRPEICNKVVINNAEHVVTFKDGYFLADPISYVAKKEDDDIVEKVKEYNDYIYASGKADADNATVDWFHTVGLGVEFLEANKEDSKTKPVCVYALDPRTAFVCYSMKPGNKPILGIHVVTDEKMVYVDCYTESKLYKLTGIMDPDLPRYQKPPVLSVQNIERVEVNAVGMIPIVEYQYNANRQAAFEAAITLMDAINLAESNRLDGIEQAVQQLCVAYNCQFEEGTTANDIRQAGMLVLKSVGDNKADFKIMDSVLDQTATQTTLDDLYDQMLEKCGVPSSTRDAHSTSDNVGAVYLRSGWAAADTACRVTEDYFRASNAYFDKVFLQILRKKGLLDIEPEDMKIVFLRNNMDNLLVKTQAAMNMKKLGLAPEIWLSRSGLSNDPAADIEASKNTINTYFDDSGNPVGATGETTVEDAEGNEPEQDQPQDERGEGQGENGNQRIAPNAPEKRQGANQVSGYYRNGLWVEGYTRD